MLDAVATASGAAIRGQPLDDRPVSADLDAVPIDDALHRLLGSQNFTLSFGSGGQLKTVVLLGGPEAPPPSDDRPTAAGVGAPAPAPPAFPLALSRAFTRHRPVPVPEQLAEALGADRATFPQLLELATVDDDGTHRAEATQVVLSALERESWLRRSFLRTLHDLDDASLQDDRVRRERRALHRPAPVPRRALARGGAAEEGERRPRSAPAGPARARDLTAPLSGGRARGAAAWRPPRCAGQLDVELVRAVAACDEVEVGHLRRIDRRLERRAPGVRDRRRRQPEGGVRVVRASGARGRRA